MSDLKEFKIPSRNLKKELKETLKGFGGFVMASLDKEDMYIGTSKLLLKTKNFIDSNIQSDIKLNYRNRKLFYNINGEKNNLKELKQHIDTFKNIKILLKLPVRKFWQHRLYYYSFYIFEQTNIMFSEKDLEFVINTLHELNGRYDMEIILYNYYGGVLKIQNKESYMFLARLDESFYKQFKIDIVEEGQNE